MCLNLFTLCWFVHACYNYSIIEKFSNHEWYSIAKTSAALTSELVVIVIDMHGLNKRVAEAKLKVMSPLYIHRIR